MAHDEGKVAVRFATERPEPATGPLTWAQRHMWDILRAMAPHNKHLNLRIVVPVPAGLSIQDACQTIATVVERHPTLRTRFFIDGGNGEPYQVEMSSGELEIRLYTCEAGEDPDRIVGDLVDLLRDHSYELTEEMLVRPGICSHDGAPKYIVLVFPHVIIDGWGIGVLRADLETILSRDVVSDVTQGHRPIEHAAFEASEEARVVEAASLEHWRSRSREFPRTMFAMHPMPAATPRYWQGSLTSPALAMGIMALTRRFRISPNSVMLAALSLCVGHYMDIDRSALIIQIGNRMRRGLKQAVGNFFQNVPIVFDVDRRSFETTARSAQAEVLRTATHARCSPTKAQQVCSAIEAEKGTRITFDAMFNTMQVPNVRPPSIPESAQGLAEALAELRSQTEFAWLEKRESEGIKMQIISSLPLGDWMALFVDTTRLSKDHAPALLLSIEELVTHVATVGDDPMVPLGKSGLVPYRRGPEWRKVGAWWANLDATAAMISERSGLSRDAIHLTAGDELTAYLGGNLSPEAFRRLPRACFEALARDESIVLPDRFVLLDKPPTSGLDDAGWRHMPVIETATLQ